MSSNSIGTIYNYVEYSARDKGVIKWVQDPNDPTTQNAVKIAAPMGVIGTFEEIDSEDVLVKIWCQIVSNCSMPVKEIITSLDILSSANLIESLAKYGLDVNSKNKHDLIAYFRASREDKPLYFKHKTLGFGFYEEKPYFKHHQTLGFKQLKKSPSESRYDGKYNISPAGSFSAWRSIIEKHVLTHPALELALVLGFSAPLVGYVGNALGLESFLFHIFGNSSIGKTTACFVATASFGSPNTKESGLITSWNATENALYGKISNNHGIPIVFDECSLAKFNDFTNLIYSIGEGREKDRMTVELNLRDTRTWMTSVISTGEKSLFEGSKENTGLKARLIEFSNVQWTETAAQSEAIKKGLGGNYGHAWKPFVEKLLDLSINELQTRLDAKTQEASSLLPKSQITDRLAKKVGLLFLTMDLCEEALGFKLQQQAVKDLIVEHVSKNIKTSDIAAKAYLDLIQYITSNNHSFERKKLVRKVEVSISPSSGYFGRLTFSPDKGGVLEEVEILTSKLDYILKEVYGYESSKIIISEFKKRGWLDCERGKTYRKRKVNGITNQVYVIKVPVANAELGLNSIDIEERSTFQLNDNEPDLFDGIELDNLTSPEDDSDDLSDFEIF